MCFSENILLVFYIVYIFRNYIFIILFTKIMVTNIRVHVYLD